MAQGQRSPGIMEPQISKCSALRSSVGVSQIFPNDTWALGTAQWTTVMPVPSLPLPGHTQPQPEAPCGDVFIHRLEGIPGHYFKIRSGRCKVDPISQTFYWKKGRTRKEERERSVNTYPLKPRNKNRRGKAEPEIKGNAIGMCDISCTFVSF